MCPACEAGDFSLCWSFTDGRFGIEEVDGVRKHAIEHYLDLTQKGRVDVSAMLTHTFALDDWRDAFETLAKQHDTGAIKAAFDFREPS